jgi:hypothetical protein
LRSAAAGSRDGVVSLRRVSCFASIARWWCSAGRHRTSGLFAKRGPLQTMLPRTHREANRGCVAPPKGETSSRSTCQGYGRRDQDGQLEAGYLHQQLEGAGGEAAPAAALSEVVTASFSAFGLGSARIQVVLTRFGPVNPELSARARRNKGAEDDHPPAAPPTQRRRSGSGAAGRVPQQLVLVGAG